MHLVVCYDVAADRNRAKLAKFLRGRLEHVQKSVFEGVLADRHWEELRSGIGKRIDRTTDTVRVYELCGRCTGLVEVIGSGNLVDDEQEDVVV